MSLFGHRDRDVLGDDTTDVHMLALSGTVVADESLSINDAADHVTNATQSATVTNAFSNALQAHSRHASGSNGDGTTSFTLDTASTVTVAPGFTGTGSAAQPVSDVTTVVDAGATLELAHAYSGTISFAGPTGTLIIDHASSFSGTITGQLAIGDVIDLADITGGANVTIAYSGNNSPGTLTVSDGTHTANIALDGQLFAGELYSIERRSRWDIRHRPARDLQTAYSLQQIDGGPNYFAQYGFTYSLIRPIPNFFAVGAWLEGVQTQQDINLDKAAGLDMYVRHYRQQRFFADSEQRYVRHCPAERVVNEPDRPQQLFDHRLAVVRRNRLVTGARGDLNAKQHHLLAAERRTITYNNFSKGVEWWETTADAAQYVNGVDVASADIYWFTDPAFALDGTDVVPYLNNGNPLSPSQIRLAANYGYTIDRLRALDATDGVTHPIWGYVELGWPAGTAADGARHSSRTR